jgi:hypothetical protein
MSPRPGVTAPEARWPPAARTPLPGDDPDPTPQPLPVPDTLLDVSVVTGPCLAGVEIPDTAGFVAFAEDGPAPGDPTGEVRRLYSQPGARPARGVSVGCGAGRASPSDPPRSPGPVR